MNMPTVGCVGESIIGNDERGLWFLSHKDDPSQMNWVEGEKCWGSVKVPMGLNVTRTLFVLENGELEECYTFENVSGEPLLSRRRMHISMCHLMTAMKRQRLVLRSAVMHICLSAKMLLM